MPARTGNEWCDASCTQYGGCIVASEGCKFCYVALQAATLHQAAGLHRARRALYSGITRESLDGRHVFNGNLTVLPHGHPDWTFPLTWKGAIAPLLGVGRPSLIFMSGGGDLFLPKRPQSIIDRVVGTLALSRHIGQILNRRAELMAPYFLSQSDADRLRWRKRMWLGTSCENQERLEERWPPMRDLAAQGWLVWFSLAPLIGPIVLPNDLLALGPRTWVIASGEQRPGNRPMDPMWARGLRDQCAEAGVPFFMKQMARKAPIPADLLIRQFPEPL